MLTGVSTDVVYPMLDLEGEVEEIWSELQPTVERVLRSGHFIGGPEVEAFEREAAGYLGARHALGLNSGTDALVLGLEALGVGPGDEVVTTPFSFFATSEAVLRLGATPVFVDVVEETLNLDPDLLERALTPSSGSRPTFRQSWPSPMHTACRSWRTARRRSAPSWTAGAWAPSAPWAPSASTPPRTSGHTATVA